MRWPGSQAIPLTAGVAPCPVPSLASEVFAGLGGDGVTTGAAGSHDDRDAAHGPAVDTRGAREADAFCVSKTFPFMKTCTSYSTKTLHKAKSLHHNGSSTGAATPHKAAGALR